MKKAGTFAGTAPERSGVSAGRRKLFSPDFLDGGFLPKAAASINGHEDENQFNRPLPRSRFVVG